MSILNLIKYEGDNDTFIWKHPCEDFNTLSQLIVHESQEAILFKNGQALDLFGPGKHTLTSKNIPLLSKLINLPFGGESPFHCEVYFINKAMPLDMKWGTQSRIQVLDPRFNILLHAGASGGMGVQIDNSRKFLTKLVGTTNAFDKESLITYFREMILTRVKTYLTKAMSNISFITINAHLDEMSTAMQGILNEDISEFGVNLVKFFVSTIQLEEKDYEQVQQALARVSSRSIEGYNWVDEQIADVMKRYAANEGSQNSVGGMAAQIPLAMAFGNMLRDTVAPLTGVTFSDAPQALQKEETHGFCTKCGAPLKKAASFCAKCGTPIKNTQNICAYCGKPIDEDDAFCAYCGKKNGE